VHGQPCECRLDSVVEWPLIPFDRTPDAERRVLISCAGSRWPPNKIGIPTLTTQASLSRLPGWSPVKQLNEHTRNERNERIFLGNPQTTKVPILRDRVRDTRRFWKLINQKDSRSS